MARCDWLSNAGSKYCTASAGNSQTVAYRPITLNSSNTIPATSPEKIIFWRTEAYFFTIMVKSMVSALPVFSAPSIYVGGLIW